MTSSIDVETQTVSTLPPITLQLGWPSPRLIPEKDIERAARGVLSHTSGLPNGLEYGPYLGSDSHRQIIATWLTKFYNLQHSPIPPSRISLTSGASNTLASILQVYTDPTYTKYAWLVDPTYFLACRIFEDNGFSGKMRPIPEDDAGICLDLFEKLLCATNDDERVQNNRQQAVRASLTPAFSKISMLIPVS
jgi:DNA-binding transcriptional MocR family regulator